MKPIIEFGPGELAKIPLADINTLPQTRTEVITESSVEELVNSILNPDSDGNPRNTLLHPPLVNFLEPTHAESYVEELNDCQGTEYKFSELTLGAKGLYYVMIGGHRRKFAMGVAIKRQQASERSLVLANPRYNMEFGDALILQMGENTHSQLPPVDEARAIRFSFDSGVKKGRYNTVSDLIRELPYSESKIRDAVNYCKLPQKIRDMVEGVPADPARGLPEQKKTLSYSTAVAIYPLQKILEAKYGLKEPNIAQSDDYMKMVEIQETITRKLMVEAAHIYNHRWGADSATTYIQGICKSLKVSMSMDSLFFLDEADAIRKQADNTWADLTKNTLDKSLGLIEGGSPLIDYRTLSDDRLAELSEGFTRLGALQIAVEKVRADRASQQPHDADVISLFEGFETA